MIGAPLSRPSIEFASQKRRPGYTLSDTWAGRFHPQLIYLRERTCSMLLYVQAWLPLLTIALTAAISFAVASLVMGKP
jgi:hypothetical protein